MTKSGKNKNRDSQRRFLSILAVAGKSGGHIFPAQAFLEKVKEDCPACRLLLVIPAEQKVIDKNANQVFKIADIHLSSLNFKISIKNLFSFLNLFLSFFESLFIILKFKPDLVAGFGSIVSVPLIIWAWLFRIKVIIHEQNVMPGKANGFLSFLANKVAVSFSQTSKYLRCPAHKIKLTGNLLRKNIASIDKKRAADYFGLKEKSIIIMVSGGSQGSQRINKYFIEAAGALAKKENIGIIHLSGRNDKAMLEENYAELKLDVRVIDFLEEMQYAYSASDLVVSRGGATTLSEIAYFKLPAIIIPYPLAYQHQLENSLFLFNKGCARLIKEDSLTVKNLKENLLSLVENKHELQMLHRNYDKFVIINSNGLFLKEALSLIRC